MSKLEKMTEKERDEMLQVALEAPSQSSNPLVTKSTGGKREISRNSDIFDDEADYVQLPGSTYHWGLLGRRPY